MSKISYLTILICIACSCSRADKRAVSNAANFDTAFTKVVYADIQLEADEYSFLAQDSVIDMNKLSNQTQLTKAEGLSLLSIMKDTACFKREGECGTYRDEACFLFYKNDQIIKVITVGCSYSYFSNSPENWPSNRGAIQDPCDQERYNQLLQQIWKRTDAGKSEKV